MKNLFILFIFCLITTTSYADIRPPTRIAKVQRVVAIGDVHGDFEVTKSALIIAKVMDKNENWIGGKSILMQTGDQLDRWDGEHKLIKLLEDLKTKAKKVGGNIFVLNGNHETLNVALDFRYVHKNAYTPFDKFYNPKVKLDSILKKLPPHQRGRAMAFRPGGHYAKIFASHNTVMIVGQTLFVHGGVTPDFMEKLESINSDISKWMLGNAQEPAATKAPHGPVWSRDYSAQVTKKNCPELGRILAFLNLKRMVIAHTIFKNINSACDGRVWRIDTGISKAYRGPNQKSNVQVLEILNDEVVSILE